ncbi:MAG: hypothetical protein ACRDKW_00160 [Actinomycetota bacterium]
MQDKPVMLHEHRTEAKPHGRQPLARRLRDNLRVCALLSTLVAYGGSTNWK